MNYTLFHLHTDLSISDSCTNFKDYIHKAVELSQTALAFTEHGNIFNWVDKKMHCEKNGIKYIHGVEIYLTRDLTENVRDNYHTILLAKNYEGFKELNNIIDLSTQKSHFYYKNRITFDEFLDLSDNIIKISACLASPLARLDNNDVYYNKLAMHYDYYEVQPHEAQEQVDYNLKLVELAKVFNKPLIAGTDTHSINKYKAECRSIRQKAKKIEYSDEDLYDLTYKNYDELVEMFHKQNALSIEDFMTAIQNTNAMADSVETFELDLSFKYPNLYKDDNSVFVKLLGEKLKYKINNGIIRKEHIQKYKDAIREEYAVFRKLDMVGFMLFLSEMLTWCRENNIPYGFCRGSVGGSRIAYVLDIIDVDPEIWGTVFSRFVNVSRKEIGDVDLDFAPSQRSLVYDYIINRFTQDKTAYILAIGTVVDKGTIDEIGRALNNIWMKDKPKSEEEKSPYYIKKIDLIKSEYEDNPEKARLAHPDIFYYFDGIVNTAVSQSMHPAGIVASPITLTDNYGTFWSDDKRILSINMEEIHEISLVKYDILGLKNIEIIKDAREMYGEKYPLSYQVNWEDEEVWQDMITSGVGIFQFESDFAFKSLKQYVPCKINDMSVVNASIRPSGESYRNRLLSREFNKNPSEQIDKLLESNNGYLIFQEDTIKFLTEICGFNGGEADNVRRAIGRKDEERLSIAMPQIFEGYCSKSNQPREIAEQETVEFLQIIEDSSRYQFGLNHSTGYSMIGYVCAYERYYHPLEFVASYLNNAGNEDDIKDGTELARLKGINISQIRFRHSTSKYTIDKPSNTIYKGLSSIKFLNDKISDELYELRNNIYNSFTDLLFDIKQTSLNSRQLNILIALGFFDEFGKEGKLLEVVKAFDSLYERKQLKIADLPNMCIDKDLIMKYTDSVTEKMIKGFNVIEILKEHEAQLPNNHLKLKERVAFEIEYMGYVSYTNDSLSQKAYYVSEFVVYKDKTKPYVKLYQIKTGETIKAKITGKDVFIDNPFKLGNVLVVSKMSKRAKSVMIGGKWERSNTEFDNILEEYEVY